MHHAQTFSQIDRKLITLTYNLNLNVYFSTIGSTANKSRSIHNLAGGTSQDQGFYQNLSVYRAQNQSHPNLGERYDIPLPL